MGNALAPLSAAFRKAAHPWFLATPKPLPAGQVGGPTVLNPTAPIGLMVELQLDSVWIDISAYVYYRDRIHITRGTADETSSQQPQTCTMTINNADGRFTPLNPSSPYFGLLAVNTPLRVSRLWNGIRWYRFYGEVSTWPTTWDISGNDVYSQITASGITRRLTQGTQPPQSAMYRGTVRLTDAPVVAYWPCEDIAGSATLASAVTGVPPLQIAGTPTLASDSSYACSQAIPSMGTGTFYTYIPSYTNASGAAFSVYFLCTIPSGGITDGSILARFTSSGTVTTWECYYLAANSGTIALRGFNAAGTKAVDTAPQLSTGYNGTMMRIGINIADSAGSVSATLNTLRLDPAQNIVLFNFWTTTAATANTGVITSITIAPGRGLSGVTIGHVTVQAGAPAFFGQLNLPMVAWVNEDPAVRFFRLVTEEGLGLEENPRPIVTFITALVGTPGGYDRFTGLGHQVPNPVLTSITDAANGRLGILYEPRNQLGIGYRDKDLYNQSARLTLDASLHQLSGPLNPVYDDQHLRNDWTVTRTGGSSVRATVSSGTNSVQSSPAGVGEYGDSTQVNVAYDFNLGDQAHWRAYVGTVNQARYPQLSINLRHPTFTSSDTMMYAALSTGIGDRLDVINVEEWIPPDPISQIVRGYQEILGTFEHDMVFNCTPASVYQIFTVADPVRGRLDTDGCKLQLGAGISDPTITVVTAAAYPTWTTNPADWPFDIRVTGERMTVTAVGAPSGQVQVLTVTRAVNGVTKTHAAGEDVHIFQPCALLLV